MKEDTAMWNDNVHTDAILSEFEPVTEEQVAKIIKNGPSKSCPLDPIPTWLIRQCQLVTIPVITNIVNLSLSEGVMPDDLKFANLLPNVKNRSLDVEILKNQHPLSNLPFVSKVIEKVVDDQTTIHMTENNFHDIRQSA